MVELLCLSDAKFYLTSDQMSINMTDLIRNSSTWAELWWGKVAHKFFKKNNKKTNKKTKKIETHKKVVFFMIEAIVILALIHLVHTHRC